LDSELADGDAATSLVQATLRSKIVLEREN
jgi:hypothetical protein